MAHCAETGCLRQQMNVPSGKQHEMCRGLHAEQNAIIQAALHGTSIKDSLLYVTHQPCVICAKMMINAGVKKVIMKGNYPDALAESMFQDAGIILTLLDNQQTRE